MADSQVTFRAATLGDVPAMMAVEAASWPPALAATLAQAESRVRTYAEGQMVALVDGIVTGVIWAQRVSSDFFDRHSDRYDAITDGGTFAHSHDPQGDIYELVGVGTLPTARGLALGRRLVDLQIDRARKLPGVRRIVGFTRPTGYHTHAPLPIEKYVRLRDRRGRLVDRVLAFHLEAGAKLVSIHPDFRPEDTDSGGYGVLIEYPVA